MSHCYICARELGPADVEPDGRRNGYSFRGSFRAQCPSRELQACAERAYAETRPAPVAVPA